MQSVHLVYNISLGNGLGFISLVSRALCSDDKVGNRAEDTDDDEDTLELGRFCKRYIK